MIMTYMMKQVEMIGIYSQCCIRDDGNDGEDLTIKSIVGTRVPDGFGLRGPPLGTPFATVWAQGEPPLTLLL